MSLLRDDRKHLPSLTDCQERQREYRIIRPSVSAKRNFFMEYCMAPAAKRNGTMGAGGGNKAAMAMASKAPSPEDLVNLLKPPGREFAFERFLPSFASKPEGDETSDHGTKRRHQSVIEP